MTTASLSRRITKLEEANPAPGGISMYTYEENNDLLFISLRKLAGRPEPGDEERQREIKGEHTTTAKSGPADPALSKKIMNELRMLIPADPAIAAVFDEEQRRAILGEEDTTAT